MSAKLKLFIELGNQIAQEDLFRAISELMAPFADDRERNTAIRFPAQDIRDFLADMANDLPQPAEDLGVASMIEATADRAFYQHIAD